METGGVMQRIFKRVLSYGMKKKDGKSRHSEDRLEKIERRGLYIARDGGTITMDEMGWAADVGERRSLTNSFASGLLNVFKISPIEIFLALLREVSGKRGEIIPDVKTRLAFVKNGYIFSLNHSKNCGCF